MPRIPLLVTSISVAMLVDLGVSLAGPVTPRLDPEKGHALADRVCVACHVVSKQGASVASDVPSFEVIANKPGQSAEAIAGRIVIPHPPMPTISLTREEIGNVVSYIMTLKK